MTSLHYCNHFIILFGMLKTFFFLLFNSWFLIACSDFKNNQVLTYAEIMVDNEHIDTATDITSIIDTLSLLLIKEPKGNYMADIFKMAITPNKNHFFYDLQTNKINVFDRSGNFIKTISKAGEGPSDPLNITDFWATGNNEIQVYDYAQMKIFNYDSQLNYVNSIKATEFSHFSAIQKIPNSENYIGYANFNVYNKPFKGQSFQIAYLDKGLQIFQTDQQFDNQFRGVLLLTFPQHFTRYRDTLRFYKAFDNHIYSVSSSGISKRYKILYSYRALPDDIYPIINLHLNEFKSGSRHIIPRLPSYFDGYTRFNGCWHETDDFIYLTSFTHRNQYGHVFISILDKKSNRVLFNAKRFFENTRYKIWLPEFQYLDKSTNELIGIITGESLKKLLFKDSKFQSLVNNDPSLIYLVKVKLK